MKRNSKSRGTELIIQYLQYITSVTAIVFMACYSLFDKGFLSAAIGMALLSAGCFMLQIVLSAISASFEARLLTEFDDYAFGELFSIGDTKKRNPNITHYRNIQFIDFINDSKLILMSNDGPIEVETVEPMRAKCSKLRLNTLVSVIVESSESVNRCKGILLLDGIFSWWLKDGTASDDENTRKNLTSLTE